MPEKYGRIPFFTCVLGMQGQVFEVSILGVRKRLWGQTCLLRSGRKERAVSS
jgi:hypothetical protein